MTSGIPAFSEVHSLSMWNYISLPILFFSLSSAWFVYITFRLYKQRTWFRDLPGPPHSFLWGHLQAMGDMSSLFPPNSHPQLYLTELANKHSLPPIWYLDLWPFADSMVILTNIRLMDCVQVLKPLAQHPASDAFLAPVIGSGVVATANGPLWKSLHNAMAPSFAAGHVKNLSGVFVDECLIFIDALKKLADEDKVFDMEEKGAELIFDVIARIVFNFSLFAQTRGSQVLDDLREMVRLAEAALSINPLDKLKAYWKRRAVMKRLHKEILAKIRERYDLLRADKVVPSRKDPESTLDLMLREQLRIGVEGEGNGKEMPGLNPAYEKLLLTNIKGLLLGGHGTTNDTLCFCYMLLSKNSAVVRKLREEHTRVFADDFDGTIELIREESYKLNELDYTTAVIKETLRLFPVGFGVRVAQPGATINYEGKAYPIDNNLCVVSQSHSLHYNPSIFPSPATFNPERFLDPDTVPRGAFRTFSRGPRACAGQNLAIDELRVILLMTVRDFEFEFVPLSSLELNGKPKCSWTDLDTVYGEVVFQELGIEAKPRGGMPMRVKKVMV